MQLAPWVRARLWPANDWSAALDDLRRHALEPQQLWELGCAYEHCLPDRSRALAVLLDAARAGHAEAAARALVIAKQLRAHVTVAELSAIAGEHAAAGRAYMDAGLRELAVEPLQKAGSEPALLALARYGKLDPEAEIATALAAAHGQRGSAAVPHYVHAARIARVAVPDKLTSIIIAATRACPSEPAIDSLLVEDLQNRGAASELLDHYRASFVAARTRREYVERMRSAACELLARDLQRGLALRLLRLALETAYEELLPEITGHLAAWEILVAHAREHKSLLELVPLVLKALAAPLSQTDAVYLARLGLEIAWREMQDATAAQPYAATLFDFVPEHPLAIAFVREANLDDDPPPADLPDVPTVQFKPAPAARPSQKVPVIKATPPPVPYGDDKPVPRASSQAMPKIERRSGRLALLAPPPPRTTTLRRDVSAIPTPPPARTKTTPRAPRVVVPIDATIELANGSFFTTVLRDMSTSGAFVVTKRKLEVGASLAIELRLPAKDAPDVQEPYPVIGKIARQTDIGYGIQFADPSPELVQAVQRLTT